MYKSVLFLLSLLFLMNTPVAHAAWPDSSTSRIAALDVLRQDIGGGAPIWSGADRINAYQALCSMNKPYQPGCKYSKWTTDNRGDLSKAGTYFGGLCNKRTEPLSCVISAWNLGFVGGVPSLQAKNPQKAVALLAKACTQKSYAPACAYWADFLVAGVGGDADLKQAHRRYAEACKAKDAYGCARLATMQMYGQGVERNVKEAEAVLHDSCHRGMGVFCADLGLQRLMGINLEKDEYAALDYFEKGCQLNDGRSCMLWSAEIAQHGGDAADTTKAFLLLSQSCKSGQKGSCDRISRAHQAGIFADNIQVEGPGYLTISSDVAAKIFVDGKYIRKAPLFRHKLNNGSHRVHIVHSDGRAKKMRVNINAGVDHAYKWSFSENAWAIKDQRTDLWRLHAGLLVD